MVKVNIGKAISFVGTRGDFCFVRRKGTEAWCNQRGVSGALWLLETSSSIESIPLLDKDHPPNR